MIAVFSVVSVLGGPDRVRTGLHRKLGQIHEKQNFIGPMLDMHPGNHFYTLTSFIAQAAPFIILWRYICTTWVSVACGCLMPQEVEQQGRTAIIYVEKTLRPKTLAVLDL